MREQGLSLIEILVAITIFAILGVITTNAIFLTLRGSKKSESLIHIRENLDYSIGVIERNLRNSNSVVCSPGVVSYTDQDDNAGSFSCGGTYIASGSANLRLTSDIVSVTNCSFSCSSDDPPSVTINVVAKDATAGTGTENSTVSTSTKVSLRSY